MRILPTSCGLLAYYIVVAADRAQTAELVSQQPVLNRTEAF
jgi:hypothetical protein